MSYSEHLSYYETLDFLGIFIKENPEYEIFCSFDITNDSSDNMNYSKPDKFGRELVSYCEMFNQAIVDTNYGHKKKGHCYVQLMDFTSYGLFRGCTRQFINSVDHGIKKVISENTGCRKETLWNDIINSDHCNLGIRKKK